MSPSTLRWAAELREDFLAETGVSASHADGVLCHDEDEDGICDACGRKVDDEGEVES